MSLVYAISDPHGCLDVLDRALSAVDLSGNNQLFLLGDYVPHPEFATSEERYNEECNESLLYVRQYCRTHRGSVTALMGNHEFDLLDGIRYGYREAHPYALRFLNGLKLYAETDKQIFVHAGVNERAANWRLETSEITFLSRPGRAFGTFEKDVVSGHRSAAKLAGDPDHRGAYWDGLSHFVIDGETEKTRVIPVLIYDTETGAYCQRLATSEGVGEIEPIRKSRSARRRM